VDVCIFSNEKNKKKGIKLLSTFWKQGIKALADFRNKKLRGIIDIIAIFLLTYEQINMF